MKEYNRLSAATVAAKLKFAALNKEKLLIICHLNPDGDCICSSFALKMIYEELGGEAKVICSGDGAPYLKNFYYNQDSIMWNCGEEKEYQKICAVDVASLKQLGRLKFLGEADKIDFMIDHHAVGDTFSDYYRESTASAAGELIFEIYQNLCLSGMRSLPEIHRRIYAAISSDTGSFKYNNTTAETMNIAASLLREINSANDGGKNTAEIARILHDRHNMTEYRAMMLGMQNLKTAADGKIAYVTITADMMEENGITELELGNLVDTPRGLEGALIAVSIKQNRTDRKSFRISMRANGKADVAGICAKFGGGGHIEAAGCTVTANSPEEAEKMILDASIEALSNE